MEIQSAIRKVLSQHSEGLLPTELLDVAEISRFERHLVRDQIESMVDQGRLTVNEGWRLQAAKASKREG